MTDRTPRLVARRERASASIEGLYLTEVDHSEPFYLNDGEIALYVELYHDGTGIVRVWCENGWESSFDIYHEETGP